MIAYYFAYFTNGWKIGTPMPNSGYVYMLATTMSLAGIVASQIGNIHCCRTDRKSVFQVGLFSNKLASIGILSEILLIFVFIYTPFFQKIFGLVPLRVIDWLLLITFPIIIISIEELRKLFMRKYNNNNYS
jgi:magnesium-transporting ATPase (P-type)